MPFPLPQVVTFVPPEGAGGASRKRPRDDSEAGDMLRAERKAYLVRHSPVGLTHLVARRVSSVTARRCPSTQHTRQPSARHHAYVPA